MKTIMIAQTEENAVTRMKMNARSKPRRSYQEEKAHVKRGAKLNKPARNRMEWISLTES